MGNKDLEKQLEGLFFDQGGGRLVDEATGTQRPQSSTMTALLQPLDAPRQRGEKLELGQCLQIIRKWWWLIVVSMLMAATVGFGIRAMHPVYRASTSPPVRVEDSIDDDYATISAGERLAATYKEAPNPGDGPPNVDTLADIAFSVEAPAQPGSYDFQWQTIHNNVERFGEKTENMVVQVVMPTPTDTPTPTHTPTPTDTPTPTHTPMPTNTPLSIPFPNPTMTPVPTATPTPDPAKIPPEWKGRIVFISDRDGGWPAYYIMDADGKNVEKLTGNYFYRAAAVRDTLSPDNQYQLIVAKNEEDTQINLLRLSDGVQKYLVGGGEGADYDPAYCQAEPRYFAWTSSQFGDVQYRRFEIVVADLLDSGPPQMRTTQMTRDTNRWEWDRHPSWSPDCKQIVFYSNRTGKDQIWVMDFWGMHFDGANQHPISDGNYNDWDPVWVK